MLHAAPIAAVSLHHDAFIDFRTHIPALGLGQPVTECRRTSILAEGELCELGCHAGLRRINHATRTCRHVWRYRRSTSARSGISLTDPEKIRIPWVGAGRLRS